RTIIKMSLRDAITLEFHLFGNGELDLDACKSHFNRIAENCNEGGKTFKGGKGRFGSIHAEFNPQSASGPEPFPGHSPNQNPPNNKQGSEPQSNQRGGPSNKEEPKPKTEDP